MKYVAPEFEVKLLKNADVLTSSPSSPSGPPDPEVGGVDIG